MTKPRMSLSRKLSILAASLCTIAAMVVALAHWNPVPAGNNALQITAVRALTNSARLWDGAFSPDGTLYATAAVDGEVNLWRTRDGSNIRTLKHPQGVTSLAFTPDGQTIITGSFDQLVRRWNAADGKLLQAMVGHSDVV
jgi:WD40 repeat protein